jgi:hypothetical protein
MEETKWAGGPGNRQDTRVPHSIAFYAIEWGGDAAGAI